MTSGIRRSVIAASAAFAAAAALVAAIAWNTTLFQRRTPLTDVVAAVGTRRIVEPRLTGGFAYGPMPSGVRSVRAPIDDAPPDVRIAVAQLEKLELRRRTPEVLAALGTAYLAVGSGESAVRALEEAVAVPSP